MKLTALGTPAKPLPSYVAHPPPRILFFDKNAPYYEFTNLSPHSVTYNGKRYPTSEHLFQAFKFMDAHPEIVERIRKCGASPSLAYDEAHRCQKWVRPDWFQVSLEKMDDTVYLKFTQHPDLKALLLSTGDAELLQDSPRDDFWGIGAVGVGRNEVGKALMRLRAKLQSKSNADKPPFPAAPVSVGGPNAPQLPPPQSQSSGLCEFCKARPKFQNHPYCGRTCATEAAKLCSFCGSKPRLGIHPYCSRTCAAKASKVV